MAELGKLDTLSYAGSLTIYGACQRPENVIIEHNREAEGLFLEGRDALNEAPPWMKDEVRKYGHLIVLHEKNGFVSNGLDIALNLLFGVSGPPSKIQSLIVAKSATNVASTDTSILGGSTAPVFSGGTQNAISKLLTAPAPAAASANAISGGMSFADTDVTGGSNFWPLNRVGLVNVAASTNLGLVDVIGNGASQANPYSRTFSVDFSSAGTFTLNPQITITGIRVSTAFPVL